MSLSFDVLRPPLWLGPLLAFGLLAIPSSLRAENDALGKNATEPAPGTAAEPAADAKRVAVELTFLKAMPGERERLRRYIERNWFEMDRIAKERGLMDDYKVLDTGSDEGHWNLLVAVTYRDAHGYAGIREAFERIRSEHREVTIDGKRMRDLGAIVESKTTYAHATAAEPRTRAAD